MKTCRFSQASRIRLYGLSLCNNVTFLCLALGLYPREITNHQESEHVSYRDIMYYTQLVQMLIHIQEKEDTKHRVKNNSYKVSVGYQAMKRKNQLNYQSLLLQNDSMGGNG
jgi:hypothetical protein